MKKKISGSEPAEEWDMASESSKRWVVLQRDGL